MIDVVLRKAVEFFDVRNFNFFLIVGDVAVKHGLLFRQLVVQLLQLIASGLVFIHTCQAELEQLALHVILGGAVGMRDIESGQGFINVTVEGERRLCGTGFADHVGGFVAERCVRMHLLHQTREIAGRVELPHRCSMLFHAW